MLQEHGPWTIENMDQMISGRLKSGEKLSFRAATSQLSVSLVDSRNVLLRNAAAAPPRCHLLPSHNPASNRPIDLKYLQLRQQATTTTTTSLTADL